MDVYQDTTAPVVSTVGPVALTIVISVSDSRFTGDLRDGIEFVPFQLSPPKPERTLINPVYSRSTVEKNHICGSGWYGWLN